MSFAVLSDTPYTPQEEAKFPVMIEEINRDAGLSFAVFLGDFKNGRTTPCSDEVFLRAKGWFDLFHHPLIYTPGDNEWTDCHRPGLGSYDPLERLGRLREIFFQGELSLGQNTIPLTRQSQDPAYPKFRENARWVSGHVAFATLHIVGSNNNFGRTPEGDKEYLERMVATLRWMREALATAKSQDAAAVVLIMHADPGFADRHDERSGFGSFLLELEQEVVSFKKPVLLVHGDTHTYRVDRPLRARDRGHRVENLTRLETFGSPHTNWVKVTIDRRDPNFFRIEPRYLRVETLDQSSDG